MSVSSVAKRDAALEGSVVVTSAARYKAEFARVEAELAGSKTGWLQAARRQAMTRFGEMGLPTTHQEDWKYTNIAPIERRVFQTAPRPNADLTEAELAPLRFESLRCHALVFIDGHYAESWSNIGRLPAGVEVESLSTVLTRRPDILREHVHRYAKDPANAFVALNGAFMGDGAYVGLPPGAVVEDPVHLLFISTRGETAKAYYPRILIRMGADSHATVVESYHGPTSSHNLTNTLTEIIAGENARVEHCKLQLDGIQAYHVGNLFVHQGRDSRVTSHSIALGAALARNGLTVSLEDEGAAVTLNGLYMGRGRQHLDHHTRIDHLKPHTRSEGYYKGVLDGHARGVFNGKVVVHENAQKTDARQSNMNLLLSDNAEVDTKPEFQIYANDVKCSHGATVGQLDEDALFYLRSRGVDQDTARALLTYAFADDVIARIGIEAIRTRLEEAIVGQLPDSERIRGLL